MYLKTFDGKRNRATVQRGYSLVQLLVVMLLVSIVATAAFRPMGIGPLGQPACGACWLCWRMARF